MAAVESVSKADPRPEGDAEKTHGAVLAVRPHPRLWVSPDTVANLSDKLHSSFLQTQAARVLADADWLLEAGQIAEREAPTYQHATRAIASRFQCLTAAWVLTREAQYRTAAIQTLQNMMNWNLISCESRNNSPPDREEFFCLSYGEHAADIALMYDVFRPDITPEEQKVFFDVLDRFYLKKALEAEADPPWWAFQEWSNWNGVCAGGMGLLALAFYDDRPEARALIPFVEKSLTPYMASYIESGGGNHEGTGYWNYGMHYAIRYLLSWENATGKRHPAFEIEQLATSLHFPLDFTGISFGDNDGWHPGGFFFQAAKRLNEPNAALRAAMHLPAHVPIAPKTRHPLHRFATGDLLFGAAAIPDDATVAEVRARHKAAKEPFVRVYEGLEWTILADDWVVPTMRLAARGGSSEIRGHGMLDLLSFKCEVNGTRMIADQQDGGYLPPTFSSRGVELYGRRGASKSTILVDGLECRRNVRCPATEPVEAEGIVGVRIDGTGVILRKGYVFVARLILLVEGTYWLIIDTARDPRGGAHWLESRFHTYAEVEKRGDGVLLAKSGEMLSLTMAALGGGVLQRSRGLPSTPVRQTDKLRWMSQQPSDRCLHVTALQPGTEPLDIALTQAKDGGYVIDIRGADGYHRRVVVNDSLRLNH